MYNPYEEFVPFDPEWDYDQVGPVDRWRLHQPNTDGLPLGGWGARIDQHLEPHR